MNRLKWLVKVKVRIGNFKRRKLGTRSSSRNFWGLKKSYQKNQGRYKTETAVSFGSSFACKSSWILITSLAVMVFMFVESNSFTGILLSLKFFHIAIMYLFQESVGLQNTEIIRLCTKDLRYL